MGLCSFGSWKEAVGCDEEIKVEFFYAFYAIACFPLHQIFHFDGKIIRDADWP